MAEGKKSFLAYSDWIETFEALSNEDAGQLAKHLFRYVNDQNPVSENPIVKIAFIPIMQTLKRDLRKWDVYLDKQRENGKKGGRPKKPKKPKPFLENPTKPKKADSVSVSDSVNVNNIEHRKLKFASTLEPFVSKYSKDTIKDFYNYWTEPNKSNTKFRQELEKTWSLERRLETWVKNEGKFGNNKETKSGFSYIP